MNLTHLRYFVKLAETRHYTRAAEQLYITQPSLSHAMNQLEKELGVPLFDRGTSRKVELTTFGESFLDSVQRALQILDESVDYLQHCAKGNGLVRLGLLRTLGVDYVPKLAASYLKENSDKQVEFTFQTGATYALLDKLKDKELDIVFSSIAPEDYGFESVAVTEQDLVLLVPSSHPFAKHHSMALEDVVHEPFIMYTPGSGLRRVVDGMFKQIGQTPKVAYEIMEDQVIAGMVANGFGIAVVPYMDMLLRLPVKIIQISHPVPERKFYMVTNPNASMSPAAADFKSYVLQTASGGHTHVSA